MLIKRLLIELLLIKLLLIELLLIELLLIKLLLIGASGRLINFFSRRGSRLGGFGFLVAKARGNDRDRNFIAK